MEIGSNRILAAKTSFQSAAAKASHSKDALPRCAASLERSLVAIGTKCEFATVCCGDTSRSEPIGHTVYFGINVYSAWPLGIKVIGDANSCPYTYYV